MPIIHALIKANFTPIIASDGDALLFLQKEFPLLKSYTLPSYNIKYNKNGKSLKNKLLFSVPSIISAVKKEKQIVSEIVAKNNICGIISDNRFGVYSSKIPSVYITHQVNVFSGNTSFITSKIHQNIIRKFDECWVPDIKEKPNLSGKLSYLNKESLNLKFIGVLSRFKKSKKKLKYDLLVVLSGVEPQRSLLEIKLLEELKYFEGKVLFVRGVLSNVEKLNAPEQIKIENYLLSAELEKAMIESKIIVARSGYSTIMDLAVLGKKAFFIPTPGQFEQEYLAQHLSENLIAPFSKQESFTELDFDNLKYFNGFDTLKTEVNLDIFSLFNTK